MLRKIKGNYVFTFSALVFVFMLYKHCTVQLGVADDVWFLNIAQNKNLIVYLVERYHGWTSRLIIEAIMLVLLRLPSVVWMILDSLMFVLSFYSMIKILNGQKSLRINLVLFALFITFPFSFFGSAGWYATTLNYAWPLGFGLYALSYIEPLLNGGKMGSIKKIFLIISLVIATNQEQMCALILGFYFLSVCYYYYKYKRINVSLISVLLFSTIILLFHATCPGNANRSVQEIATFYPSYENFTIIDKLVLGVLSTFSYILIYDEIIVLAFVVIMLFKAFQSKKIQVIIVSLIPFFSYIYGCYSVRWNLDGFVNGIVSRFAGPSDYLVYDLNTFLYIFIILVEIACILFVLYNVLRFETFIYITIVLLAALASRVILGFSATIFASLSRTFVNMFMLFILADVILLFDIKPQLSIDKEEK